MNVVFLNSVYSILPQRSIGPYLLKHYLKKRGYTSQVIDFCQDFTSEELLKYIDKFVTNDTICLAVSSTFWYDETGYYYTYDGGIPFNIYECLKLFKQKYPSIKIALGGAHSSYIKKRIESIDAVFIGEAEDTLPEVLDYWSKGHQQPPHLINPITNKITYKDPTNKTHNIEHCDFQWQDNDCIIPGETLPLETSRGCIFKCRFCAYPHLGKSKFDYLKSNDKIRDHLVLNKNKYGVTRYVMLDDTFNDSEFKVDGFLDMVKTLDFNIEYSAYIRADLVQRYNGSAEKLFETGLRGAFFGLESIHPVASQIVGKGWSGRDGRKFIPKLVNELWNNKVATISGLIVGLPGESKEDLISTLTWVNDNNLNVIFFALQVTNNLGDRPFLSEFEREAEKYNFKFDNDNRWYNETWSRQTAIEFADSLNHKRKHTPVTSFNYIIIKSLGFTDSELLNKTRPEIIERNPKFFERREMFIKTYKNKLLELCNIQN
jgi:hypothetical protein